MSSDEGLDHRSVDRRLYDSQQSFDRSYNWLGVDSPRDNYQTSSEYESFLPSYHSYASAPRTSTPRGSERWNQGSNPLTRARSDPFEDAGRMRFQRPPPLAENIPAAEKYERWRDWKSVFDVAISITEANYSSKQKAGLLYTSVGHETQKIIQLLKLPPQHVGYLESGREYEELSRGLNDYFRGMVDESVDHNRFYDAKQAPKESVHDFTFRLRTLAIAIGVDPATFTFKLQFLKGMRNRELAIKSGDENTPLRSVIQAAARREQREAIEATSKQGFFRETEYAAPVVARVQEAKKPQSFKRFKGLSSDRQQAKGKACYYCGGRQHQSKKECPAYGKSCNGCGRPNHFEKVCQQGQKAKTVSNVESDANQSASNVRNSD